MAAKIHGGRFQPMVENYVTETKSESSHLIIPTISRQSHVDSIIENTEVSATDISFVFSRGDAEGCVPYTMAGLRKFPNLKTLCISLEKTASSERVRVTLPREVQMKISNYATQNTILDIV